MKEARAVAGTRPARLLYGTRGLNTVLQVVYQNKEYFIEKHIKVIPNHAPNNNGKLELNFGKWTFKPFNVVRNSTSYEPKET